jgi:hypothetical protein
LVDRKGRADHATANACGQVASRENARESPAFAGLLSLPIPELMRRFFEIIFTAQ